MNVYPPTRRRGMYAVGGGALIAVTLFSGSPAFADSYPTTPPIPPSYPTSTPTPSPTVTPTPTPTPTPTVTPSPTPTVTPAPTPSVTPTTPVKPPVVKPAPPTLAATGANRLRVALIVLVGASLLGIGSLFGLVRIVRRRRRA